MTTTIAFDAALATATIRELKAIAKEHKIAGYSRMVKADLLAAIRNHFATETTEPEAIEPEATETTNNTEAACWSAATECSSDLETVPAPISATVYTADYFIPDYALPQATAAIATVQWARFLSQAAGSTARAIVHAAETKQLLHILWLSICYAIAATILAGRICGRAWHSATAKRLRYQLERWFTGQVLESLGTQPHQVLPLKSYDYGNNLSDLARSALS